MKLRIYTVFSLIFVCFAASLQGIPRIPNIMNAFLKRTRIVPIDQNVRVRTLLTRNSREKTQQDESYAGVDYTKILAIGLGLSGVAGISAQDKEPEVSASKQFAERINKSDMDVNEAVRVLEEGLEGTESDKAATEAYIALYRGKKGTEKDKAAITAYIVKHIDTYPGYCIPVIFEDFTEQNKELIITACMKNLYKNIQYYDSESFASILRASNKAHLAMLTEFVKENADKKEVIYHLETILKLSTEQNREQITSTIAHNIYRNGNEIDKYSSSQLGVILGFCNKQNQNIITKAIVQKIDADAEAYVGWSFFDILNSCSEQNQSIIIEAIIQRFDKYSGWSLSQVLSAIAKQGQDRVTLAIVENIKSYVGADDLRLILQASNEKNKEVIMQAIIQNISVYPVDCLRNIIAVSSEQNQKLILNALINNGKKEKKWLFW